MFSNFDFGAPFLLMFQRIPHFLSILVHFPICGREWELCDSICAYCTGVTAFGCYDVGVLFYTHTVFVCFAVCRRGDVESQALSFIRIRDPCVSLCRRTVRNSYFLYSRGFER